MYGRERDAGTRQQSNEKMEKGNKQCKMIREEGCKDRKEEGHSTNTIEDRVHRHRDKSRWGRNRSS